MAFRKWCAAAPWLFSAARRSKSLKGFATAEVSDKLMDSFKALIFPELAAIRETQVAILARLDVIDKRFDNVDQRFENVEKRFESLEKRFESLERRLEDLRSDQNQRFAELRSDADRRLCDFRAEVDKRLADLRADMNARAEDLRTDMNARVEDLRADINARFAEGRTDLNKRLDDFRMDINQRLGKIAARFRGTEDDLRYIRENKVVEILQRHEALLDNLMRDFNEMLDRIRAIEQKSLKKLSKKVAEVKQSAG